MQKSIKLYLRLGTRVFLSCMFFSKCFQRVWDLCKRVIISHYEIYLRFNLSLKWPICISIAHKRFLLPIIQKNKVRACLLIRTCDIRALLAADTFLHKRNVTGGLSIVNGAPAMENVDPEILRLCDIFCVNETEVRGGPRRIPANRDNEKYRLFPALLSSFFLFFFAICPPHRD